MSLNIPNQAATSEQTVILNQGTGFKNRILLFSLIACIIEIKDVNLHN